MGELGRLLSSNGGANCGYSSLRSRESLDSKSHSSGTDLAIQDASLAEAPEVVRARERAQRGRINAARARERRAMMAVAAAANAARPMPLQNKVGRRRVIGKQASSAFPPPLEASLAFPATQER